MIRDELDEVFADAAFADRGTPGRSAGRLALVTALQMVENKGLIKPRGRQRTDSTHVLATVRDLNRLELRYLAGKLGHRPKALDDADALAANLDLTPAALPDEHRSPVAHTWSMSIDLADTLPPWGPCCGPAKAVNRYSSGPATASAASARTIPPS